MIKMNKIWVIKCVKIGFELFPLCKIISKAIELMPDFCKEKCCPWFVLMGENYVNEQSQISHTLLAFCLIL